FHRYSLYGSGRITNWPTQHFHQFYGLIGFEIVFAVLIRNGKTTRMVGDHNQITVKIGVQCFEQPTAIRTIGTPDATDFFYQYLLLAGLRNDKFVRNLIITGPESTAQNNYTYQPYHKRC